MFRLNCERPLGILFPLLVHDIHLVPKKNNPVNPVLLVAISAHKFNHYQSSKMSMSNCQTTTRFQVLLIDPLGVPEGHNVGLAYLASSAREAGHEVEVLHLDFSSARTPDRIRRAVKNKDYIGVSLHAVTAQYSARRTARLVKAYNPDCVLLVGGPHITLDGKRFLEECPDVDIAVIGYGELTLVDILTRRPLHGIPGLMFREGDSIILNREREELIDLDALPYPDYSVFDNREAITSYHITTSRGCPYQCTYCAVPMMNRRRWRFRSVENIIDDIRSAEKAFDRFSIIDDTFTQNISRAKRFCAEYIKSGIELTWELPCGIRADKLDEELTDLMKRAGCTRVALGIETFDARVFESLNKRENISG